MGILPRIDFRTGPGTFRVGVEVTRLLKDCPALVRIVHSADVGLTYPIVTPIPHTRGASPDTWALFVESVVSPIIFLTTPMFPLSKPATQRLLCVGGGGGQ